MKICFQSLDIQETQEAKPVFFILLYIVCNDNVCFHIMLLYIFNMFVIVSMCPEVSLCFPSGRLLVPQNRTNVVQLVNNLLFISLFNIVSSIMLSVHSYTLYVLKMLDRITCLAIEISLVNTKKNIQ